ncbi:hypothetical protein PENSPDRAFT_361011 [Peniophora sp. CONT]|nr:hypothetical protein PENSPDRAFT_361011 [Peniophora sp. CONT]
MATFAANMTSHHETVIYPARAHIDGSDSEAFILNNCPSLLNIVSSADGRKVVQFIHFSAKEYLTSPELTRTASPARDYSLEEDTAKLTLARLCIASINLDDLLSGFQPYAAQFFDDHISSPIADVLRSHSFRFPKSQSSELFNSWAHIYFRRDIQNTSYKSSDLINAVVDVRGTCGKSALHIAAQLPCSESKVPHPSKSAAVTHAKATRVGPSRRRTRRRIADELLAPHHHHQVKYHFL